MFGMLPVPRRPHGFEEAADWGRRQKSVSFFAVIRCSLHSLGDIFFCLKHVHGHDLPPRASWIIDLSMKTRCFMQKLATRYREGLKCHYAVLAKVFEEGRALHIEIASSTARLSSPYFHCLRF